MMQNPRVFLWIALSLVLWLNYEAWQRDYAPANQAIKSSKTENKSPKPDAAEQRDLGAVIPRPASLPAPSSPASQPRTTSAGAGPSAEASPENIGPGIIHVRTDVLDLDISKRGGTIQRADLLRYPKVKGGSEPVRLMNQDSAESEYLLETGLTGAENAPRPTHLAGFESDRQAYDLGDAVQLRVPLTWSNGRGVEVTKTYIFERGQYRVRVEYSVSNRSGEVWQAAPYAQIQRTELPTKRSMFNVESYAFHGPALYDGTKYRKLEIDDEDDRHLALQITNGWIAALQHHFVSAIVPPKDATYRYTLAAEPPKYVAAAAGPMQSVPAGTTGNLEQTLYVGPKLQAQLKQTGPELERVADYGMLTILSKPLFWLLEKVYGLFGNWGWSIIFVTFLLKLAFYPLSEASGKSMAKMKHLAPRIKNLQETHKGDREKLGRAMMELYQREKVNPVAGCLPMIIQIPVFLAFYWVLLESVEMRQAPFMGWINDLSSRDPWFILPALMAGAMFVQYKLNPTPPDPVQAKIFMFMPLVMSVMFAFFPAGLVLYWVTNTVLSIAQQWNINRRIEARRKN
jgi:YidC/Oxa1 family membrane protein insertase